MGSSSISDPQILAGATALGRLIAEKQALLITGATNGAPLAAARGARLAGGEVIGFSPAANPMEHSRMGLPLTDHDFIIYTGLSFAGRNILNVRASHGIIFIGGSMGALNEFTISYDEEKIMGILEGSGGFCDHMKDWMRYLAKPNNRAVLHYSRDPEELLALVLDSIGERSEETDFELP